jgi:IS4 transposase
MNIISLNILIKKLFSNTCIETIAKECKFLKRLRSINPHNLFISIISTLSKGDCDSIAGIHRQFNGMSEHDKVAYRAFHYQLKKDEFIDFMKYLFKHLVQNLVTKNIKCSKLNCFKDILLQDGSTLQVHKNLRDIFPSRANKDSAAIECHMTMYLLDNSPKAMTITADTAPERTYLPDTSNMKDKLLLADAGYMSFSYFEKLSMAGGYYIVRGTKSLNPKILEVYNGKGKKSSKLIGKSLSKLNNKTSKTKYLDLKCQVNRGKYTFRAIRCWFPEENRFCTWLANLPASTFSAEDITSIYRCRWQVELLFKELKQETNWRKFATHNRAIVEGLVWASLLSLIIRRQIATQLVPLSSVFKVAKNVDMWFLPILSAIFKKTWRKLLHVLKDAEKYILKNAMKTPQRKSKKHETLDGILAMLDA